MCDLKLRQFCTTVYVPMKKKKNNLKPVPIQNKTILKHVTTQNKTILKHVPMQKSKTILKHVPMQNVSQIIKFCFMCGCKIYLKSIPF